MTENKETTIEKVQEQTAAGNEKITTTTEAASVEAGDNGTTAPAAEAAPPVKEMRALSVSSKTVKLTKAGEPTQAGEGEVAIRVAAVGLGFNDILAREKCLTTNLPKTFTLGFELAGTVELVGENVTDFQVGDRVVALVEQGAGTELAIVNAKYVYKIASSVSFDDAVALTLNYTLAHFLVHSLGNVQPGQTILVSSVAGGVGQAIVQLASNVGNVTIIGTAHKDKHEAFNKHEQVTKVTHLFDTSECLAETKKLFPDGIDIVFDGYGDGISQSTGLLKPLGKCIVYGLYSALKSSTWSGSFTKFLTGNDKIKQNKLFDDNKTISGFNLRQFLFQQNGHDQVRKVIGQIFDLYAAGKIKPVIDTKHAFEDFADAVQRLQEHKNIGKVILDPAQTPKPKPVEEETTKKRKFSSKGDKKSDKSEEKKDEEAKTGDEKKPEEATNPDGAAKPEEKTEQ